MERVYKISEVLVGNTPWKIMVVTTENNELLYVEVIKTSKVKYWGIFGKTFTTFDEAIKNYKNTKIKAELERLKTLTPTNFVSDAQKEKSERLNNVTKQLEQAKQERELDNYTTNFYINNPNTIQTIKNILC